MRAHWGSWSETRADVLRTNKTISAPFVKEGLSGGFLYRWVQSHTINDLQYSEGGGSGTAQPQSTNVAERKWATFSRNHNFYNCEKDFFS